MPDDLYERDILLWSGREADRLRRLSRGEVPRCLADTGDRDTPSLRQRIDPDKHWRRAVRQADLPVTAVPPACRWTPDHLPAGEARPVDLAARVG